MNAPTLDLRLKALHLISFLAHYRGLAEQAAKGGWSPASAASLSHRLSRFRQSPYTQVWK